MPTGAGLRPGADAAATPDSVLFEPSGWLDLPLPAAVRPLTLYAQCVLLENGALVVGEGYTVTAFWATAPAPGAPQRPVTAAAAVDLARNNTAKHVLSSSSVLGCSARNEPFACCCASSCRPPS